MPGRLVWRFLSCGLHLMLEEIVKPVKPVRLGAGCGLLGLGLSRLGCEAGPEQGMREVVLFLWTGLADRAGCSNGEPGSERGGAAC